MDADEYQKWWEGYEPRSPTATTCPRCGCDKHHSHGPSHSPFGLGIVVVCFECHKSFSHVDKWLRTGLREDKLAIPDEYESRVEGVDDPDELYDSDRDSEGAWLP